MWHICQTHPSQVIRNCFGIWASGTSAHPHTQTNSRSGEMRWWWGAGAGAGAGGVLVEGAYYSLPLCAHIPMLAFCSRRYAGFQFLYQLQGDPIPPPTVSCTNLKCSLTVCVSVWDRHPLSASNHLSHFTLNPTYFFFKQILAPTLLLLTVRGFVSYPRYKTPIHSTS